MYGRVIFAALAVLFVFPLLIERDGAVADGWLYDLWLGEKLLEGLGAEAH
jgi:hypothetical protein